MALHKSTKGLDLPMVGEPAQKVEGTKASARVAVLATDFVGMKPRMHVQVGDEVKAGQLLFENRKVPGVRHTAPIAGRITAIHRGEFRALQSIVIEPAQDARAQVELASFKGTAPAALEREAAVALLVESGLWALLRARPYGRTPSPSDPAPHAIFVTAMDSSPHAPDMAVTLANLTDGQKAFSAGLEVLTKLAQRADGKTGKVYVCKAPGAKIDVPKHDAISIEEFQGPHPSGTVGFHIHTLAPVSRHRVVWHIGLQQLVSIGRLALSGQISHERVISLAGPQVRKPRLLKTQAGASVDQLVEGELVEGENRVVAGSVLFGRKATGDVLGYLGLFTQQVSALREGREREFLGWLVPGFDRFSTSGIFVSQFMPRQKYAFTTTTHGSHRAMVPIGLYERVFPFDILPTFLLRAILVDDLERAENLGVLELDEEDLALCTFVCQGKYDYGEVIRRNLDTIWKEG
jgi:Na+-transporting NADH:ubiquinone oxidoreductase subunit A